MRFDVVIGNPPYNRGMDLDFIELAYRVSKQFTCMIVPAKWQTADGNQSIASTGTTYGQFRRYIVPRMKHVVFYPCCKDVFDIAQVDGITYFLLDKDIHSECLVENKCKYIECFNSIETRSIQNRESLFNIGNELVSLLGDYKKFRFNDYSIVGNFRYEVWTNTQVPGGGLSKDLGKASYFVGESHIEDTCGPEVYKSSKCDRTFASNNISECESFISWLNTKFTRFFVAINISKLTGIMCDDCFRFVPAPPSGRFDHIYTDDELYEWFKIPQKYRDAIGVVVKERKE